MQLNFRLSAIAVLSLAITFTACTKEESKKDDPAEISQHSQDQSNVSNEMDAVTNEVNAAIEADGSFAGRQQNVMTVCNVTAVADTTTSTWTLTLTYSGANCAGTHTRTGTVVISKPAAVRWRDAGATLTVTYNNFKVTRVADNKSITINGAHTLTNVTGGLLFQLPNLNQIIHTLGSNNMSIKFDDNTVRTWQVARKRTYTYNNGIVFSVEGTHSHNGQTGIAEWGTDRFGHSFYTSITQPLIVRQDCMFRLTAGQVSHNRLASNATVTFGLNATGQPTSCPGANPYFFKLVWTGPSGIPITVIHPY
jgi:hypothetical protein